MDQPASSGVTRRGRGGRQEATEERRRSRTRGYRTPDISLLHVLLYLLLTASFVRSQCPWPREITDLNGSCLCAFNLQNELSIQCTAVNFTLLMTVLHQRSSSVPLDLLYVNNTRVSVLNDRTFDGLVIENIQFSSCGIFNVSEGAFKGLEKSLVNLNLQDNRLAEVPTASLTRLGKLKLLDLSGNRLTSIPDEAFKGLRLSTLKLADNELSLSGRTFSGLEGTLKNLNLKGTKLRTVPQALRGLPVLAFLDIAQNQIRGLEGGVLRNLHSLTALNIERNLLQALEMDDFKGVNDTLSSLSLLNNLITDFPSDALNTLTELRVLDIGFNLITEIPEDGFRGIKSLTLLALDGNPLTSVPGQAFTHLNTSLRGLSVGGRFLHCDCKVAWIPEWIRDYDLQVTSRERSPQFCGQPPEYRERSFYQLSPEELSCSSTSVLAGAALPRPSSSTPTPSRTEFPPAASTTVPPPPPPPPPAPTTTTTQATAPSSAVRLPPRPTPPPQPPVTSFVPGSVIMPGGSERAGEPSGVGSVGSVQRGPGGEGPARGHGHPTMDLPPQVPPTRFEQGTSRIERPVAQPVPSRPNLVLRNNEPSSQDDFFGSQSRGPYVEEVIVQDAYRKDNSVIIQWDSEVSNILGFRVVYRLFGDKNFKLGPPLAASEREFKIKNVPTQECIVVCVVSLEDVNVTPDNVQYSQCREIRTETSATMHMDTIIIAASAAICGTVIIAVIIFICCNRKRGGHREKEGIPAVLNPVSPPLASLGTLGSGTLASGTLVGASGPGSTKADWDTLSMYSQRSIPRARMYHLDKGSVNNGFVPDDVRSHISHASSKHLPRPRSMADGQSQRSYSALSAAHLRHPPPVLGLSRQDLNMSRHSLAASQFSVGGFGPMAVNPNAFGMGGPGSTMGGLSRATSQRSDRRRQRSKSRERAGSRLSHAESNHSLTGYDTDGWTDHDMDIYVARNPTRGGLVQL